MNTNKPNNFSLPSWAKKSQPSIMEKLLSNIENPKLISFALGLPAMEFFPTRYFQKAMEEITAAGHHYFQYTPPQEELKSRIVELMAKRGVICTTNEILLTSGAQQGINLLTRLFLEPNDTVITEELTYPGLLQALLPLSPKILTVPTDPKLGLCVESVKAILKKGIRPKFLYIVTDGSNPHGVNLSIEKRYILASLANQYEIPIIEDDAYGFLNYHIPFNPLKTYCADWTFYIGSFSKILAPALRVGWIVAHESLIPKLSSLKECCDINTSTLQQHIINIMLRDKVVEQHIPILCQHYAQRRNQLVSSLYTHFPNEIKFNIPDSGIFLWVDFNQKINTSLLLQETLKNNVLFIPSESFSATKQTQIYNGARLNFSNLNESLIDEGIQRLATSYKQLQNSTSLFRK